MLILFPNLIIWDLFLLVRYNRLYLFDPMEEVEAPLHCNIISYDGLVDLLVFLFVAGEKAAKIALLCDAFFFLFCQFLLLELCWYFQVDSFVAAEGHICEAVLLLRADYLFGTTCRLNTVFFVGEFVCITYIDD